MPKAKNIKLLGEQYPQFLRDLYPDGVGKKGRKRAKKLVKRMGKDPELAARLTGAMRADQMDLEDPSLDSLINLPEGDFLIPSDRPGSAGTISDAEYRDFLTKNPGRLQSLYSDALWNDSAGNPDSRFGKLEANLLQEANLSEPQRGLQRVLAATRAGQATNIAEGVAQRQIRATGVRPDSDEAASMKRQFGIQRVLNRVDAQNAAEKAMDERRDMVRDYSFDAEGSTQNAVAGGLASAAQEELNRKLAKKNESAGKQAGLVNLGGTLAGLAISAFASSDAALKENVTMIGDGQILEGLRQLDVSKWHYKGEDAAHIGPMAQDFQQVFGIGDGKTLKLVDVMGVLIGALRELAIEAQK